MATHRKKNARKNKQGAERTQRTDLTTQTTVEDDGTQTTDRPPKREKVAKKVSAAPEPNEQVLKDFVAATCQLGAKGIMDEFLTIRNETQTVTKPKTGQENNPERNRYKDVYCIDETRVILKAPASSSTPEEATDYIHANWVKVNNVNKFICTQGPTEKTVEDFWRMVWQEKSPCVVMLCNIMEMGKKKCEQYWPETVDKPLVLLNGQLTVKATDAGKDVEANITLTKLQMLDDKGATHNVAHWRWKAWPDRGVPERPLSTFRLLYKLKSMCPIVVHCSAGIGRTGTIVGLDVAYQKLIAGEKVDLNQIVREIRNQRHGSVQTDTQYLFMHRVLIDFAENKFPNSLPDTSTFISDYNKLMGGKAS